MNYWFYLEPYSFILQTEHETVIYNSLDGAYLSCPQHSAIKAIIDQWNDAKNGYGTLISDTELSDPTVAGFVSDIKEAFAGDCIPFDRERPKPYLFKPDLYLNTALRVEQEKTFYALGERVLQNLHEITLYLPTSCNKGCKGCQSYYKQFHHCVRNEAHALEVNDYKTLLRQFHLSGVRRVNIIGGDLPNNEYACTLVNELEYDFKKVFYVDYKHFSESYLPWLSIKNSEMNVLIHPEDRKKNLPDVLRKFLHPPVKWNFIVSSASDLAELENLNLPEPVRIKVIPYYNGKNEDFFKEYIYSDLQDILAEPVSRKTIFRHKVLNDNFFGKLTIMPSGEVYSNVNRPAIGHIKSSSLKELVYKELTESQAWLKVRNKETPCSACLNRDLCPPLSNYELIIGKSNLCTIKS